MPGTARDLACVCAPVIPAAIDAFVVDARHGSHGLERRDARVGFARSSREAKWVRLPMLQPRSSRKLAASPATEVSLVTSHIHGRSHRESSHRGAPAHHRPPSRRRAPPAFDWGRPRGEPGPADVPACRRRGDPVRVGRRPTRRRCRNRRGVSAGLAGSPAGWRAPGP